MGLFDLFSNDSAEKARDLANAGATAGYGQLSGLYGQGREALGSASNLWNGLYNSANGGAGAYGDATGANGQQGFDRAQTNFRADPGYQFKLDQGLQALSRAHAAAGNLSSGNADADAIKYGTGLADQSYGDYVSRLAPYLNQQTAAAAGYGNTANNINASFGNQGNAANQTQTTIGTNDAGAELNNYKVGANLWNGITGGLNFLSGGAGGSGGINGLVKNAGSLFRTFS